MSGHYRVHFDPRWVEITPSTIRAAEEMLRAGWRYSRLVGGMHYSPERIDPPATQASKDTAPPISGSSRSSLGGALL